MTENEAIKIGKIVYGNITEHTANLISTNGYIEFLETAIKTLEEKTMFNEIMHELSEYQAIGTIEEFKALKEKSEPKKARFYAHNYYCTECGNLVGNNEFKWQRFLYCDNCGQKLDWQ